MAKSLAELTALAPKTARAVPVPEVDPELLKYWVVVRSQKNKLDGSPRFKMVTAHATEAEADAERMRRQGMEADRKKQQPTHTPFEFFVIERPAEGEL